MRTKQTCLSKDAISHSTTTVTLVLLGCLWLTLLPIREAAGQGTVIFANQIPGDPGIGITLHIWAPSPSYPNYYPLIGLGSNDSPSGTTPFAESGMSLIGASGSGGHFGYATTFAQLLGAVGANQPEYVLFPVGQATTFRSGAMLGSVVPITDTLTGVPGIPKDAAAATFEIVAWDNSSGIYPTWTEALAGWANEQTTAGRSAPFTVWQIGGGTNSPPYLNNSQGGANGMTSFSLYYYLSVGGVPVAVTLAATDITATSATLNATFMPSNHCPFRAAFQWGTTPYYGNVTPGTNNCDLGNKWPLKESLTGLTPGTTYHFRAITSFFLGSVCGSDQSFTTPLPYALTISTGRGYWGTASSTLSYKETGGPGASGRSFVLLQSADPTAPLSAWTRVATNTSVPGSFPIPPAGTAAPKYYRIKSQ